MNSKEFQKLMKELGFRKEVDPYSDVIDRAQEEKAVPDILYTRGDIALTETSYGYMLAGTTWAGVTEESVLAVLSGAVLMNLSQRETVSLWNRLLLGD